MEKIRLGLVGCGKMMKTHASAVDACTEQMSITAICDIIPERMEEVAEVLDHPFMTTDYTQMLDYVDAVLVALPHDLHYECGLFFANHQKHFICSCRIMLCNSFLKKI